MFIDEACGKERSDSRWSADIAVSRRLYSNNQELNLRDGERYRNVRTYLSRT